MIINCANCNNPVHSIIPVDNIICHNCWNFNNPNDSVLPDDFHPFVHVLSNLQPAIGHHPELGQHDFN